ncbi:MAG: peptidylprolyl isomerase [Gemmataceae bacterium]
MRTIKSGDRVCVHYVKRFEKGMVTSSRRQEPLEVVVAMKQRRLPGLGSALEGLTEGQHVRVVVPADLAYGLPQPGRVHAVARSRFPAGIPLVQGRLVKIPGRSGRLRPVRIIEVADDFVVVDTNHPWAGQSMSLEVEVVSIQFDEK